MVYFKYKIKIISQNLVVNTWCLDSSTRIEGEENSRRGGRYEDAGYEGGVMGSCILFWPLPIMAHSVPSCPHIVSSTVSFQLPSIMC